MVDLTQTQRSVSPGDLYDLMAAQVKSYQRHYRLGDNTSISTETARELLGSIQYTLNAAGPGGTASEALARGQALLAARTERARGLLRLLTATENAQSSWFWDAAAEMGRYLDRYDPLHFAHRSPELLCYPIALPLPEGMKGIDEALFYLNCLWQEDQILCAFSAAALEELQAAMPPGYWAGPELLCQQPLLSAAARTLLGLPLDSLLLGAARERLPALTPQSLLQAGERVSELLALPPGPAEYARAVLEEAIPRLMAARDPAGIFP